MPSLADLLNAPSELHFEGKTYLLREPTLLERGQFQRWMEAEARASAAAATDLPEEDRRQLLRDVNADIAAKRYAWAGLECVRCLGTPAGAAKLLSIVCADQGVDYDTAARMCEARLLDIARVMLEAETGDDPAKKAAVGSLLKSMGLPPNFLSGSSFGPAPTAPATSPPSAT